MSETRPLALVTNDDGIRSPLFEPLLKALHAHFRIRFAAPSREQSWIGRALSRRRDVTVEPATIDDAEGWMIDGTPTDCVNLALGHLLDERPAIVVSGLNIGYNTTMPMLLSSGTLAGAIEGAHWGLPALAVSQALHRNSFLALQEDRERLPSELVGVVEASTRHAAEAAAAIALQPVDALVVHNLNYPPTMTSETPVRGTVPAEVTGRSLFAPVAPGCYRFSYAIGEAAPSAHATDRESVHEGFVSWTRLNFSRFTRSIEIPDLISPTKPANAP